MTLLSLIAAPSEGRNWRESEAKSDRRLSGSVQAIAAVHIVCVCVWRWIRYRSKVGNPGRVTAQA